MGDKRGAIALIAETPNGAALGGLELQQTGHRASIHEIRDGVEPLDSKAAIAADDHPLGGGGLGREAGNALRPRTGQYETCQQKDKGYSGAKFYCGATAVSFLPLCRHS